jgi:CDP-glucose 4,6-dehydratase
VEILKLSGANVRGLSLAPESQSHFLALGLSVQDDEVSFVDIRDFESVKSSVIHFDPELVFHLAAQPLVRESFVNTQSTFETNFMGGVNLLESLRSLQSLQGVVFITSDKAYENVEWEWGYRESDRLGGIDPYSASKSAVELAVASYSRSIFIESPFQVVTTRAGNVIGGGDWSADRIVPDVIRSVQAGHPVVLRNPQSTRPWQHVLEPLSGYLLIGSLMLQGSRNLKESYNFGPDFARPHSVLEVVESLIALFGSGSIEVVKESNPVHEANLLHLNCDRAKSHLGWHSRWDFDQTIKETGNWYQQHMSGLEARVLTARQIKSYFWELS